MSLYFHVFCFKNSTKQKHNTYIIIAAWLVDSVDSVNKKVVIEI